MPGTTDLSSSSVLQRGALWNLASAALQSFLQQGGKVDDVPQGSDVSPLSPKPPNPQHLSPAVRGALISPSPAALDLPAVERHKAVAVIYLCILT